MEEQSQRTELEMLALVANDPTVLDSFELTTDLFSTEEYGNILIALQKLFEKDEKVNQTSIGIALKGLSLEVKKVTIKLIFNTKPESSASTTHQTLLNLWRIREGKKVTEGIGYELSNASPEEVPELLASGAEKLDIIAQNEAIEGSSMSELTDFFMEDITTKQIFTEGIYTGYSGIDDTFNGYKEGQIGVIGAGTGVGKTTFALNMAYNMAREGHNVGFLSLEMTKKEILNRVIGIHTNHSVMAIENRNVPEDVADKASELKTLPLYVYEMYGRTVDNITATLIAIKRRSKAVIIFIDYIGLIMHKGAKSLHENYANIISKIKITAQKLQIPIICLAQSTRESNKEGYNADSIQYSAGISSTAHQILILKYKGEYSGIDHERDMDIKIVKNRGGKSFIDVPMKFNYSTQRISQDGLSTQ